MRAANFKKMMEDSMSPGLGDVLRRLSTNPKLLSQERKSMPADARERLEILLREIDEIVLPRTLWIQANGTDVAALTVANRRLSALTRVDGNSKQIAGESSDANELAMQLLEISKSVTSIRVTPLQSDQPRDEEGSSVSVAALRVALGLDQQVCEIDQLTELLETDAEARLVWTRDYSSPSFTGADTWHASMEVLAKRAMETFNEPDGRSDLKQTSAIGFAMSVSENQILVLACNSNKGLCCIVPKSAGLTAVSNWQTISR